MNKIILSKELADFIKDFSRAKCNENWKELLLLYYLEANNFDGNVYLSEKEHGLLSTVSPLELHKALYEGFEVEYSMPQEGDVYINNNQPLYPRFTIIKKVNDEYCSVLGHGDDAIVKKENLHEFYKHWKLLCKKNDRKDI